MYLDREFRDMVIRRVHNDPAHRVAPSYGFDLVPVVRHAWQAWWLETAQQVWILLVFVVGYLRDAPAAITAACGIGLWYLGRRALRTAPEVLRLKAKAMTDRWLRRHGTRIEDDRLRERTRLLSLGAGSGALLLVAPVIAAGIWHVPLREAAMSAATCLVLPMAVAAVSVGVARQWTLNRMHKATSLRPATLTRRQKVIDDQQSHTVVVYRRPEPKNETNELPVFPDPDDESTFFVGSGRLVHRWLPPLAIQLLRPGQESMALREHATPPFRAHELVEHLRQAMRPIGHAADPIRLPGFQVDDRVYVAETDVAADRECLRSTLSSEKLKSIIDDPHGVADHFLEVRVTASGELVTTVFLRVTVKGRSLSLDFAACALTRTPKDYHLLDAFAESGTSAVVRSALRGLRDLPDEAVRLWRLVEAPLVLLRAAWAWKDWTLVPRRGVTIGTRLSIRAKKSASWDEAAFDEPTILDHMKIIELRLLKATEDFLEAKNVDTSTFKKRAETIISASVLNMGGRVDIRNSAVGANAQVNYGAAGASGPAAGAFVEGAEP